MFEDLAHEYRHECGYCAGGSAKGSVNLGFSCSKLPPELYQRLINDGWRRSGHHIYRPVLEKTCCALQSIRLHAFRFRMSKSQRHVLVKFLREVMGDSDVSKLDRNDLLDSVCAVVFANEQPCRLTVKLGNLGGAAENFELFKKYQMAVHHESEDDVDPSRFEGFLVNSPLKQRHGETEGPSGSWHTEYRMDGKLIAVGVIDIFPGGISSVYCYYDPELRRLSLGTVSCLLEIGLTRLLHSQGLIKEPYYHLGYYLESCPKLRYKASYRPYELLNRDTGQWEASND